MNIFFYTLIGCGVGVVVRALCVYWYRQDVRKRAVYKEFYDQTIYKNLHLIILSDGYVGPCRCERGKDHQENEALKWDQE